MTNEEYLDWMCIGLNKGPETEQSCDYHFHCNIYGPDPSDPPKKKITGCANGLLRIDKATGEIALIEPMPGDEAKRIFVRAARKILTQWQQGKYPNITTYASG